MSDEMLRSTIKAMERQLKRTEDERDKYLRTLDEILENVESEDGRMDYWLYLRGCKAIGRIARLGGGGK